MTADRVGEAGSVGRVLIVDDDDRIRGILAKLLRSKGCDVLESTTGIGAVKTARGELPDVILLDVVLPDMNGFKVCQQLRGVPETAATPILMVTALPDRKSRLEGIAAGASDFLSKPVDAEEVLLRVQNAVRMKHMYDELQMKNKEMRALAALRQNLTRMVMDDDEALAAVTEYLEAKKKRAATPPPVSKPAGRV
jgi:DNA-binding response OmpR family regulator